MDITDRAISVLIPACILLHLALAPYTKVEESFNIQAIHDISTYGLAPNATTVAKHYDHVEFPGSVPRTFVGAYILAAVSSPLMQKAILPEWNQVLVRAVLGTLNALAMLSLRRSIRRSFGRATGNWYGILQASQFHIMFYASRTLPNMFAFAITTFALRTYIIAESSPPLSAASNRRHALSLALLTIAGVIFRSELAVLVATQSLYLLFTGRVSLAKCIVPAGISGLAIGLLLTVPIDSHFWQRFPMWPEWTSFYFNTVLGKSSEWGISPWHFYFTNAIPKLLINPLNYLVLIPLSLYSTAISQRARSLLVPELAFVAVYSILPHKEWRFIVYIIPGLTAVSAMGAAWIWNRRTKSPMARLANLLLIGSVIGSFVASAGLLAVSRFNYPGGQAMSRLHSLTRSSNSTFSVFADNLACQTGVTRFLEARGELVGDLPKYRFDKTENATLLLDPQFWSQFDYALVEYPERVIGRWEAVDVVSAFSGFKVIKPGADASPETTMEQLFRDTNHDDWKVPQGVEEYIRRKVMRGWWITISEPKLTILGRIP